jgi:hypothetical protein
MAGDVLNRRIFSYIYRYNLPLAVYIFNMISHLK